MGQRSNPSPEFALNVHNVTIWKRDFQSMPSKADAERFGMKGLAADNPPSMY
jgi:hypothetical protein